MRTLNRFFVIDSEYPEEGSVMFDTREQAEQFVNGATNYQIAPALVLLAEEGEQLNDEPVDLKKEARKWMLETNCGTFDPVTGNYVRLGDNLENQLTVFARHILSLPKQQTAKHPPRVSEPKPSLSDEEIKQAAIAFGTYTRIGDACTRQSQTRTREEWFTEALRFARDHGLLSGEAKYTEAQVKAMLEELSMRIAAKHNINLT